MNNLTDRAMLIQLNISVWSARRYDKAASQSVESTFGSAANSGRYHKKLVGASEALMKIKLTADAARTFHYMYTLPWSSTGARVLPSAAWLTYTGKMKHYKSVFYEGVEELVPEYPQLKQNAQLFLGRLFNEEDYPHDIRDKFQLKYTVLPLPDAGDFRVHLADDEIDAIKEQITLETKAATDSAMREVWQRLHDAVAHMAERLAQPDAVFRDTLVGNVRDLCDLLPLLNLTNDPQLTQLGQEVALKLVQEEPNALRENKILRARTAQAAAAIQSRLSAFMGVQHGN